MILASASQPRAQLLRAAGYAFEQIPAGIAEEDPSGGIGPAEYVQRLAGAKARHVAAQHPESFVIGADTVAELDGAIIGKADSVEHAVRILLALGGRTHNLWSGLCVLAPRQPDGSRPARAAADAARVTLRAWDEGRVRQHVARVMPLHCAGAYALQEGGSAIIERIEGDPTTIVGLPLGLMAALLAEIGYR